MAGKLDFTASLITREYIAVDDEAAEITPTGTRFLTAFGIDLSALSSKRRHFCRLCMDWRYPPSTAGPLPGACTSRSAHRRRADRRQFPSRAPATVND